VKISFPRPVTAGSFEDRDLHAGQQHVPLAGLRLPGITAERPSGSASELHAYRQALERGHEGGLRAHHVTADLE
jgi:hypothetical protein